MFTNFAIDIVNKFNRGDSINIVRLLNIWWRNEKKSNRLDNVKETMINIGSMVGVELIYWNNWYDTFVQSGCNYKYTMIKICNILNINEDQSDLIFKILIDNILLDDLMKLYSDDISKGNLNVINLNIINFSLG